MDTVVHVAAKAAASGVRVLLNAAPAEKLDLHTLAPCDPLVVNEHEARILLEDHDDASSYAELAKRFLAAGVRSVVITLGAAGSVLASHDGNATVPAHRVPMVDTTGAGDAFVGATAHELARGATLLDAVQLATGVSALAVQTRGAQSSYPHRSEVDAFLAANPDGDP